MVKKNVFVGFAKRQVGGNLMTSTELIYVIIFPLLMDNSRKYLVNTNNKAKNSNLFIID